MKIIQTSVLLLFLVTLGCAKDAADLPVPVSPTAPIDYSNAQGNCFRCEINGEEWVPQVTTGFGSVAYHLDYSPNSDVLSISVVRELSNENIYEQVLMLINNIHGYPNFLFTNNETQGFRDYEQNSPCNIAYYTNQHPSTFEIIENDTVNKILEAKFDLQLYNQGCGTDSITHIMNGHFRLHY